MDFYQKYELLDLLKDEGVKMFNARETATGRQISMFLFVGEQARLHAGLLEQLRASQRPDRADLLEVGDNQGTPFVATEPLGGLADLKRKAAASAPPPAAPRPGKPPDAFTRVGVWHIPAPTLSGARGATPVTPAPPAATAMPAQAAAGEFTRQFQAAAPPQPIGEDVAPAARPPAATGGQAGDLPHGGGTPAPGEFTRMFQAAAPPRPIGEDVAQAARPPARPAQAAIGGHVGDLPHGGGTPAPGEFTRMFQAAAPPQPIGEDVAPAARPPARPAQAALGGQVGDLPHGGGTPAAGEFTRMFQTAAPPRPIGEDVAQAATGGQVGDLPHGGGTPAAGEFTRMFQAAAPPRPIGEDAAQAALGGQVGDLPHGGFTRLSPLSKAPAPGSSAPGEFTRIFGRGDLSAAQAPTPAPSAGPGEYTRMFSAQPAAQPQPATPTPAPAPASTGAKKVPWLMLALIVAVVVLLAVVAVLTFALRK